MRGRDKATPQGRRFFKQLKELAKLQVRVGYQRGGDSDPESGADIVDIAAWNELGTEHIPSRPFLRQSVDKNRKLITAGCREQIGKLVEGKATTRDVLEELGKMQIDLIRREIRTGGFAPNAPITVHGGWMRNQKSGKPFYVKGKKSDTPLIDTGRLRSAIQFVIEAKGDD